MRITSLLPLQARGVAVPNVEPIATPDEESVRFRVTDVSEVGDLLQQLIHRRVPVALAPPGGAIYTAHVMGCDPTALRIVLGASGADVRLRDLVDIDEALAVAYLDQIRLEFDLAGLMLIHGSGGCVLHARWPKAVYRFQRRDAFRVRPLDHQRPLAHLIHPPGAHHAVALRVIDVSLSGLALHLPEGQPPIKPGAVLDPVEVDLDVLTRLDVGLHVVHVAVLDGGGNGTRLGCEWDRLSGQDSKVLHRFIDLTQRRQRLMQATARLT